MSATLDELAVGDLLMVTREVLLPVSFALMVRPGTGLARRTPGGDPPARGGPVPALAATALPDATVVPALSTAAAAAGLPTAARPRRRDRRTDRGRALPARGAGQRRRGQP